MKAFKLIGLTPETKKALLLQAVKDDIDLKLHCEEILEKAAGTYNGRPEKVPKPKKPRKKRAKKVVVVVANDSEPIKPKNISGLNITGVFKMVEPKIYTNGKCFEYRYYCNVDLEVKSEYFKTKKLAKQQM